jgi:predicted amidohydrolase YtcJ
LTRAAAQRKVVTRMRLLIREAEVEGGGADVRIEAGRIAALGRGLAPAPGERVVEARGGALLPGLHDHHLHLLAWAAALGSVACGPPAVRDEAALAAALQSAPGAGFVRGVGYHESVAGALDRARLDALLPGRPLRIQHRSGALWMLNSAACRALGLDEDGAAAEGVERDAAGVATGRLFRLDAWLRARLASEALPDLAPVGAALARVGVTGVTDATPGLEPAALAALAAARGGGALPQRLVLLGAPRSEDGFAAGPAKLVLDERALPPLAELVARVDAAHAAGRGVAVHCVTRAELVIALAALEEAGVRGGDRIEHASVAPPELVAWLARLGVSVVTQPGFVRSRGDDYLREVEPRDRPWLYRCAGFASAGVALGAGTDAPFGEPDPWRAMQAAVDRRTAAGERLGAAEALSPERALALFTTPPDAPGGAPRRIAPGASADLCLLDRPWARMRDALAHEAVAATIAAGAVIWLRDAG